MNLFTKLARLLLSFALCAGAASAANETLTFNDNSGNALSGTYNPTDTFSVDVFASWNGYDALGFDYWLEAPNALAPNITLTATPFTFLSGGHLVNPVPFATTASADPGYMHELPTLGSTGGGLTVPPGTYHVSAITFSLNGAAPGTYVLQIVHLGSRLPQIFDDSFVEHPLVGRGTYTLTVVPEPATWSLIALGGIGALTMTWLRARHN